MNSLKPVTERAALVPLFALVALLAACGGGQDAESALTSQPTAGAPPAPSPAPSPSPSPSPAPAPAPGPAPTAGTYYFSDCQAGAAPTCVPGDNANAGTSASAPKRDLGGFNVDAAPAGTRLLFARGGAWNMSITLQNPNTSAASPLEFDAYGSGAVPVWRTTSGTTVNSGSYGNTLLDGGYVFRNLKFEGAGGQSWAFFLHSNIQDLTLENVEISGHQIGVHSQSGGSVSRVTIRNANVHHNWQHGFLGDANDLLIENSTFAYNNMDGGVLEHAIYLGGVGRNATIRNNTFTNNSAPPDGVCTGGNLTIHGQWDGILIEGNTISQADSVIQCYGISLNPGYNTAEWMRNVVVRNNTVVDVGCGICTNATPGIVVEGNRIIQTRERAAGINVGLAPADPGDDPDSGATIRNNTACYEQDLGQAWVRTYSTASVSTNARLSGSAATTGVCAR